MKVRLLPLMLLSALAACQPSSDSSVSSGGTHPVTLQTGGYSTAGVMSWIIPEARAAVSNLNFCFKRLRFKKDLTDTSLPETSEDNVDFELGQQTITSSGTLLGTVQVPEGTYYRVEFDLEPECAGQSASLSNDFGSFSSNERITVKFDGVFVVDGATTLELGVQNILDAANGHSAGRLRDSLESASGSL